jgi:hypothetical protein
MPASIEDVAKLANVSISTVSRVINRRQLVNGRRASASRPPFGSSVIGPTCSPAG